MATNKDKEIQQLNFDKNYYGKIKKQPEVLKLNLSLDAGKLSSKDENILKSLGMVKNGITRQILVPADITLHALHYVIQRAFGWQNSHLHQYTLPEEVFQMLTNGKNVPSDHGLCKHDGLFTRWADLCGIYFRFPL